MFLMILNSIAIYILVGSIGALVYLKKRSRFLDFFLALGLAGLISEGLKYIVNRPRPLLGIERGFEGSGFPSTHTSIAFAAVFFWVLVCHSFSSKESRGKGMALICALVAGALFVGVLRILSGAHYPIDVFAGAIIGMLAVLPFRYYDVRARSVRSKQ